MIKVPTHHRDFAVPQIYAFQQQSWKICEAQAEKTNRRNKKKKKKKQLQRLQPLSATIGVVGHKSNRGTELNNTIQQQNLDIYRTAAEYAACQGPTKHKLRN